MKCVLLFLSLFLAQAVSVTNSSLEINGIVTDSAGLPIEHAHVTLKQTGRTVATTDTNDKGEFALTIADTANLLLLIELQGFAAYEQPVGDPARTLRIQLSPAN